mmetsp:Transcript_32838/g.71668  ORF Transcript_32838/g.71668 Transcript_32838/m.71668 type:complete len:153 (+) Transcript_32838:76-534(+)
MAAQRSSLSAAALSVLLLAAGVIPASAGRLLGSSRRDRDSVDPSGDGLRALFLMGDGQTPPEGPSFDEFCNKVTKAIVFQNEGVKKKAGAQVTLICASLQFAPDANRCEAYGETLMGHLHDDSKWNLEQMDYGLFCKGMKKVVKEVDSGYTR